MLAICLRRLALALAMLGVALTVVVSTSAASTSVAPVKVMVIAPWDNPILDYTDVPLILKDAASWMNAKGFTPGKRGINGTQVVVIACNDKFDANFAEQCARQAADQKVAAVIGGYSAYGNRIYPILEQAQIPWIGGGLSTPNDYLSPMSFPNAPPNLHLTAEAALAGRACKRVSLILPETTVATTQKYYDIGLKSQGKDWAATVVLPRTATDMAPYVAQATKSADCIVGGGNEAQMFQIAAAMKAQGSKQRFYALAGSGLTQRVIDQYPDVTEGWVGVSYFPSIENKIWKSYLGMLAHYNNLGKYEPNKGGVGQLRSYTALLVFAKVASQIKGPITNTSLMKALNTNPTCRVDLGGLQPKLNFCKENPVPELKRLFNTKIWVQVVRGGKFVDLTHSYQDMPPNYVRGSK